MKFLLSLIVLGALVSCGNSEKKVNQEVVNYDSIKDSTIEGVIDGRQWTFTSGRIKQSFFDNESYTLDLWDYESADPCNDFPAGNSRRISINIPKQTGSYAIDGDRTASIGISKDGAVFVFMAT